MFPPVHNGAKIMKIHQDFPELWSQMFCHLFMVHSVYQNKQKIKINNNLSL